MPDRAIIDAMRDECPGVDLQAEHRKFCDYWRSKGERRVDWNATWRNWIRRANGENPRTGDRSVSGQSGRVLTPAEITFAKAKALKEDPDPSILAAAGIPMPDNVAQPQLDAWGQDAIEAAS